MPGGKWAITYTEDVLLAAAERIVSEAFGAPVQLALPDEVRSWDGRTWTRRCRLVGPTPTGPASVILKQFRLGEWHGMAEWAGLEFIDRLGLDLPFAPRIYGGDGDLSLIVVEDLGDAGQLGLSRTLAGDDPDQADDAIVAVGVALGRLHAYLDGALSAAEHAATFAISQPAESARLCRSCEMT